MKIKLSEDYATLEIIKELTKFCDTAYYAVHTTWWTVNPANLYKMPDCGLPCDPRQSVLMQAPSKDFIKNAEANPENYGKNGIDAFVAAYHGNIITEKGWPTSLGTWEEVNDLVNERIT